MKIKGIASLLSYSLLIGTLGFFTRMVEGLDMVTIVFFRALLAALFILGFAAATKSLKDLIPSNIPMILIASVCQCGMMILFIGAVLNTSITNAVFINQAAPIFAVLFSRLFLREKISRSTLVSIVISGIGVTCMFDIASIDFSGGTILGDAMALGSSICFAGGMVASKSLTRTNSTTGIAFWQMALSAIMLTPFVQISSSAVLFNSALPLLGIGFLASGIGFLFFMAGVKNLDAQTVLIVPSFGLIIPAAGAWLLYNEVLATSGFVGCVLILVGVLASQVNFKLPTVSNQSNPMQAVQTQIA